MIRVLLTIDDIPSDNTCAIVDYLNEAGIQSIMFAEGEKAEKNPEPVVYAVQHGMIVGNHSYSHPHFSELSLSEGIPAETVGSFVQFVLPTEPCHHVYVPSAYQSSWTFGTVRPPMKATTGHCTRVCRGLTG